jgi:regulatory protein YycH of two-component signal transduction system YycFG
MELSVILMVVIVVISLIVSYVEWRSVKKIRRYDYHDECQCECCKSNKEKCDK